MEIVATEGLLSECLLQMTPAAVDRGVTLHYEPGAAAPIQAVRRRLAQVVNNLLSNAIQYNRPDGLVELSCALSGAGLLDIIVSDAGPGISFAELPRLFMPFNRMDAAAARIEGTGLGLTLSRELMTAMGGTLHGSSQEGVGSIFTASTPLAVPADAG